MIGRILARLALALVALVALVVFALGALTAVGCCAIDEERFPEQAARNHERQQHAEVLAVTALVTAVGAGVSATRVGRGGRERG